MKYRRFRLQDQIREEISSIIQQEIKDPGIGFITILEVRMTEDLKYAKVLLLRLRERRGEDEDGRGAQTRKGLHQARPGRQDQAQVHAGAYLRVRHGAGPGGPHRGASEEGGDQGRWKVFGRIKETIDKGRTFLVTTHVDPDGDAVGSAFAFALR